MDSTLTQILSALFTAHQSLDALRTEREKLLARIQELEVQPPIQGGNSDGTLTARGGVVGGPHRSGCTDRPGRGSDGLVRQGDGCGHLPVGSERVEWAGTAGSAGPRGRQGYAPCLPVPC